VGSGRRSAAAAREEIGLAVIDDNARPAGATAAAAAPRSAGRQARLPPPPTASARPAPHPRRGADPSVRK
jgi:hypothetical protein